MSWSQTLTVLIKRYHETYYPNCYCRLSNLVVQGLSRSSVLFWLSEMSSKSNEIKIEFTKKEMYNETSYYPNWRLSNSPIQLLQLFLNESCSKQSSSSSSCHTTCTDLPDPLSQTVSIVHRSSHVFKATSCIGTELLYIASSWSSYLWSSICWGP